MSVLTGRNGLVLATAWKRGPGRVSQGPFMISVTQYTPRHLADGVDIWRASSRLADELVGIEGAVGVSAYARPFRRDVGSISIWTDETGLETFIGLPYHVEIMNRYRPRGLPIRSATWWSREARVSAALREGLRMLDTHRDRRRINGLEPPSAGPCRRTT
ncbi:hypothetical protein [Nocardia heshunensis]